MNWKNIIQELLDAGMTQAQIADACIASQGHISCLYREERKCPSYDLGSRLIALHKRVMRQAKKAA